MKTKTKMKAISGILFNAVMGAVLAFFLGTLPAMGAVVAIGGSFLCGGFMPSAGVSAGVLTEIWTGEMVKRLRSADTATWLDGIPDYSNDAENDVIHLVDVGADPEVLINNSTYPIPVQDLDDADIAIGLDKYQTKVTRIKDDALHGASYDIIGSHVERHSGAITENKFKKAIHAFGPAKQTDSTPVISTSGSNDGTGRKRITLADIIALKAKFDKMEVPNDGRRLVLCSDHINDLLLVDQHFKDQYYNYTSGKIANLYGFEVHEYVGNPYYSSAGAKLAFKSTPGATDRQASVAFYTGRMFKCSGSTKFYYRDAATSPETQESTMNYRHYFIALPKKQEAIGAIYSATTA